MLVLLIVFTLLFVGKIAVAERSRRLLRSDLKQLLVQAVTPLGADTGLVVFFDRETDELFTDDTTAKKVDQRWHEYFPTGQEMGDSDRAHLD